MKRKVKLLIVFFVLTLLLGFSFAVYQGYTKNKRNVSALFDRYGKVKSKQPLVAKHILELILKNDPQNNRALQALIAWYSQRGDTQGAMAYLKQSVKRHPENALVALEYANLLIIFDDPEQAYKFLALPLKSNNRDIRDKAHLLWDKIPTRLKTPLAMLERSTLKGAYHFPYPQTPLWNSEFSSQASPILSYRDKWLNRYYSNRQRNPRGAWLALNKLLARYPSDVPLLMEAAYLALQQKQYQRSLHYFLSAYRLKPDYSKAMELGYVLSDLKEYRHAYYYFKQAAKTNSTRLKIKAENAMTGIAPYQYKVLPEPWFANLYYVPLYMSRFDLFVSSLYLRVGRVINKAYDAELYLFYRRTKDNRSGLAGPIPEIFEDNLEIYGIGVSFQPFKHIPLRAFVEIGRSHSLIPVDDRPKSAGDLTAGLTYYNDWGEKPDYAPSLTLGDRQVGNVYADVIYYSRYDSNVIGFVRAREGIRLLRYHTGHVDLYMMGVLILDTNHEFFNNIFSWGPGISYRPSSHYNVTFRFEFLTGHYLPTGNSSENPYSSTYHNNLIYAETDFRF